jgi:hypothetical protein
MATKKDKYQLKFLELSINSEAVQVIESSVTLDIICSSTAESSSGVK